MKYRKIIRDAWAFTQQNKSLMKWYGFLPALISTVVSIGYIVYQYFAFIKSPIFSEQHENLLLEIAKSVLAFIQANPDYITPLIITAIVVGFIYIFYPTFAQGAMIQIIARKRTGQDAKNIDGIRYGLKSFLPLFEYHLIIRGFSITAIVAQVAFVLRNLGTEVLKILMPVFIFVLIVGLIMGLLFTYAELYIVVDRVKVFRSMRRSSSLVLDHWQHTLLVLLLLFIIGLRIVINTILVLVIPILIVAGLGLAASLALGAYSYLIAGIVALIGLYLAGYLGGNLSVFSNAVWTFTFLELTQAEELDARGNAVTRDADEE